MFGSARGWWYALTGTHISSPRWRKSPAMRSTSRTRSSFNSAPLPPSIWSSGGRRRPLSTGPVVRWIAPGLMPRLSTGPLESFAKSTGSSGFPRRLTRPSIRSSSSKTCRTSSRRRASTSPGWSTTTITSPTRVGQERLPPGKLATFDLLLVKDPAKAVRAHLPPGPIEAEKVAGALRVVRGATAAEVALEEAALGVPTGPAIRDRTVQGSVADRSTALSRPGSTSPSAPSASSSPYSSAAEWSTLRLRRHPKLLTAAMQNVRNIRLRRCRHARVVAARCYACAVL